MNRLLAHLGQGLLDLIYPARCLVCDAPGETGSLCERCVDAFEPIPEPICAVCGRPREYEPCGNCTRWQEAVGHPWGFDVAHASAIYRGTLQRAIHRLKYEGKENLGEPLGAFLANRLVADGMLNDTGDIAAVAFVPIHSSRARIRGYNQARLLAEPVAAMLGVPLLDERAIRRIRSAAAQAGLSDRARRTNIVPATFAVSDSALVTGKHLLLIDDVFTTGATVSACAAALKQAGATQITVATLAAGG